MRLHERARTDPEFAEFALYVVIYITIALIAFGLWAFPLVTSERARELYWRTWLW